MMKKFYREPVMAIQSFESENVVTNGSVIETVTNTVTSLDGYSTVTGTLTKSADNSLSLTF